MSRRNGRVRLALVAIALTGCAAQQAPVFVAYATDVKYSGVAVFNLKRDAKLEHACDPSGKLVCDVNALRVNDFARALEQTALFDEVDIGGVEQDFGIAIGTSLAPDNPSKVSVTSLLLWRGRQLGQFEFDLPYSATMLSEETAGVTPIAQSIISHIVRDITANALFTPEHVWRTLQASDYLAALDAPLTCGPFTRYDLHKFVDPLLGIAIRYRHEDPQSGHIDVFVYPIQSSQWADPEQILRQESSSVRRDLERLREQGVYQVVRLRDDELLHWGGATSPVDVLRFSGELASADFQPFDTATYFYLAQDKMVKVRATRARNTPQTFDPDEFVMLLLTTLQVPPESEYMKQVRQYWLESRD